LNLTPIYTKLGLSKILMPLDRSDRQALQSEPDELTGEELERSETPDTTTTRRGYAKAGIAALTAGLAGCSGGGGNNNPTGTPTDTPSGDTTLADTATATPENNESPGRNLYEEHPEMFVHFNDENFKLAYAAIENQAMYENGIEQPGQWNTLLNNLTNGEIGFDEIEYQIQGGQTFDKQDQSYIAIKPKTSETWNNITENIGEEVKDRFYRIRSKAPNALDTVAQKQSGHIILHGRVDTVNEERPNAIPLAQKWVENYENEGTLEQSREDIWRLSENSEAKADLSTISSLPEKQLEMGQFGLDYRAVMQDRDLLGDFLEIKRYVLGPDGNITDQNVGFNGENPLRQSYEEAGYK
jgi:hypothetical protein